MPKPNPDLDPQAIHERGYMVGRDAAWRSMLGTCLCELDVVDESPEAIKARWVQERLDTVAALRTACENFGDTDWPDDLYLPDVIEKHLVRWLEDGE